jgi:hypothetical protein
MQQEARKHGRRKTLFGGKVFDDQGLSGECLISDFSASGAKVRTQAAFAKGAFVYLKITKFNDLRRAEVMWVKPGEIGLRFLNVIAKAPASMEKVLKPIGGSPGSA